MTEYSKEYADYIAEELQHEVARRDRHENRGLALITMSGTVLAIVVAIRGLSGTDVVPTGRVPFTLMAVGLAALVVSAALGLVAQALKPRPVLTLEALRNLVSEPRWTDEESVAANAVAQLRIKTVAVLRRRNRWTAVIVGVGLWAQLAGFAGLAAAVLGEVWL